MLYQVTFDQMNRMDESNDDDVVPIAEMLTVLHHRRKAVTSAVASLDPHHRQGLLTSILRSALRRVCWCCGWLVGIGHL
jgi:hypothetical protein